MVIKRIEVAHFGTLTHFVSDFNPRFVVLPENSGNAVLSTIYAVLSEQCSKECLLNGNICDETQLFANIQIKKNIYDVLITKQCGVQKILTTVTCDKKIIPVKEFYRLIQQLPEENRLNQFMLNPVPPFSECLKLYKNPDAFYGKDDLTNRTSGIGITNSFRMCLKEFICRYRPQQIFTANDLYYIALGNDGVFTIECAGISKKNIHLSQRDQLCFELQCFLNVNCFWSTVEKIRDFNHIKRPLFIKEVPKINVSDIKDLSQKENLKRQIFIFPS